MNYAQVIRQESQGWHEILVGRPSIPYGILFFVLVWSRLRPDVHFESLLVTYLSAGLIGILFLVWLITPQKKLDNRQLHYIVLFGILMVLAVPFARHFGFAYATAKSFVFYMIIGALVMIQFINTYSRWERYLRWSVMLSGVTAIIGIASGGRIAGIPALGDENDFCLYLNTVIPLAFFLAQGSRSLNRKMIFYGCVVLFVLAVLMTFSRGGFVGLVAVGLFMVMKTPYKLVGSFLIGLLALSIYFTAPGEYWQEIESIKTENIEEGTGKTRVEYWKAGVKIFKDNPIMGVGPKNYGVWLPDYHATEQHKRWGRVAHSVYIDVLAEMGILGALLFLALIWRNFLDYRYIKRLEHEKASLLLKAKVSEEEKKRISESIRMLYFIALGYWGSLIAFLVTGTFISVLYYGYFWGIAVAMAITVNIARKMEGALTSPELKSARS
jgi:putative inorganic carbon (hco3(-)) transporter